MREWTSDEKGQAKSTTLTRLFGPKFQRPEFHLLLISTLSSFLYPTSPIIAPRPDGRYGMSL